MYSEDFNGFPPAIFMLVIWQVLEVVYDEGFLNVQLLQF
jgi:hypothetical protein